MNDITKNVLLFLKGHNGADNCVQSSLIERVFKIKGSAVRRIISRLRRDGYPVCSSADGYFYAKNHEEIDSTIIQLKSRAKKMNDAAQGLTLSHQTLDSERGDVQ